MQEGKNLDEELAPLLAGDRRGQRLPSAKRISVMGSDGKPSRRIQRPILGVQKNFRLRVFESDVRNVPWMFYDAPAIGVDRS